MRRARAWDERGSGEAGGELDEFEMDLEANVEDGFLEGSAGEGTGPRHKGRRDVLWSLAMMLARFLELDFAKGRERLGEVVTRGNCSLERIYLRIRGLCD